MEILLDTLKWSVITGVLALGLALLQPILEKRYRARWRYWAWLILAVLALLAPVQWENVLPAASAVSAPVVVDVPRASLSISRETGVSVQILDQSGVPAVTGQGGEPAGSWTVDINRLLPALWLTGAAAFLLYHLTGAAVYRRRALRWSRIPSEELLDIYDMVWQDMELEQAPPLRISSAVGSPMLTGVLHPCLLLPGERWNRWESAFILRHELTHYRRRDLWYKLVLLAANALHWFNPLMYLLVREAGADLELTCDDEVVAGLDRDARRAYSETLLTAIHQEKSSALSTHFYGGKEVMKERFRNILTKRRRKWGVLILALTLLAAIASACAFGLRQTEQEPPPDEPDDSRQDDSAVTPAASTQGRTESFIYNGLRLTVTNVREIGQGSAAIDNGETFPYTIYTCYPGAQASVISADMEDGTYADWAFDLASGEHIDITNDTGPVDVTADTLGVYNKEASVYVLRFEMYDESGTEPAGQPIQGEEPDITVPGPEADLYHAVLLEDEAFWDTGTDQVLTLSRIKETVTTEEDLSVNVPYFTLVDLDHDGNPEVVLWLRINDANDVGFEVLHCVNGSVYGYLLYYRSFNELKTDGTFSWANSAADSGIGTLAFSEYDYTINDAGTLGDTDVTWYDFTPENTELLLRGIAVWSFY